MQSSIIHMPPTVLQLPGRWIRLIHLIIITKTNFQSFYLDVAAAEASGCEYVIVMMHFGYEYVSLESERIQRDIVKELIANGADIIFGGHPHVLQPVELFYEVDGTLFEEPKVVIYSLGNFIASQRNVEKLGGNTDLGVIFNIYFKTYDDQKTKNDRYWIFADIYFVADRHHYNNSYNSRFVLVGSL